MAFVSHRERGGGDPRERGAVTGVIPCIVSHGEWNYQQDLGIPLTFLPSCATAIALGYGTKLNKPSNAATR